MDVFVTDGVHSFCGKVASVDALGRYTVAIACSRSTLFRQFYKDGFLVKRRGRGSLSKLKAFVIL